MNRLAACFRFLAISLVAGGVATPVWATDLGWRGLEVRGGLIAPADWDTGYTLGLAADLGEITDGLHLLAGLQYGTAEDSEEVSFTVFPGVPPITFGADREITSIAVGAEVRYFFSGGDSGFYAGGGPYLHRLDYEEAILVDGQGAVAGLEVDEIGAVAVGGYRLGRSFYLEARYDTVSIFRNIGVVAGFRFGK